jgi:hypothetical protein
VSDHLVVREGVERGEVDLVVIRHSSFPPAQFLRFLPS